MKCIQHIQCANVLVLGNGFDLHHGMKTKYSDYIDFMRRLGENYREESKKHDIMLNDNKYYFNKFCKKFDYLCFGELVIIYMLVSLDNNFVHYFISYHDEVKEWIDFETLIKKVTINLDQILSVFVKLRKYEDIEMTKFDENHYLILKSFTKIFTINSHNIPTVSIKEEFINCLIGVNKKGIIKVLRKEFDGLCNSLGVYLRDIEPFIRNDNNSIYSQIRDIKADAVVTFNYTSTWKRYGINSDKVIYVHGSLEKENIVLGFDDDNEEDLTYLYFKKYMQCILKKTPILENFDFIYPQGDDGNVKPTIHFFGHSLDVTDKEKLLYLFECAGEVKVYYYDEDDREEKIEKIIRLLGKKNALSKIYENEIFFLEIERRNE